MIFLMITFLMIQLQSFSRLLLVLAVVPMGLIGIVAALLTSGKPLGFVAILGILALVGMIARNAVILVEQIETERALRAHLWDAVVEATISVSPDHSDGGLDRARLDPHCPDRVLGADGFRDHGRAPGRDRAHADCVAGALCGILPGRGAPGRKKPGRVEDVPARSTSVLWNVRRRKASERISG
jgi:hypothetical protein